MTVNPSVVRGSAQAIYDYLKTVDWELQARFGIKLVETTCQAETDAGLLVVEVNSDTVDVSEHIFVKHEAPIQR